MSSPGRAAADLGEMRAGERLGAEVAPTTRARPRAFDAAVDAPAATLDQAVGVGDERGGAASSTPAS